MNIFIYLDKLAGCWLDWRMEQAINRDPEFQEMKLESLSVERGEYQAAIIDPGVAHMADMMSELLVSNHAKNYVSFELLPRLDRGKRPILVTVQWRDGKSPGMVRDELLMAAKPALDYFESNCLNFQYEKMKDYLYPLKLLVNEQLVALKSKPKSFD